MLGIPSTRDQLTTMALKEDTMLAAFLPSQTIENFLVHGFHDDRENFQWLGISALSEYPNIARNHRPMYWEIAH
jgi:hypothetical protein